MMHLVFLALYLVALLVYASAEAKMDADSIKAGASIDHVDGFVRRLIIVFIMVVIVLTLTLGGPWDMALLMGMAYGLWTPTFRLILNLRRGKDWCYISRSNRYDTLWFNLNWDGRDAGVMAYLFEAFCFIVFTALYFITNTL